MMIKFFIPFILIFLNVSTILVLIKFLICHKINIRKLILTYGVILSCLINILYFKKLYKLTILSTFFVPIIPGLSYFKKNIKEYLKSITIVLIFILCIQILEGLNLFIYSNFNLNIPKLLIYLVLDLFILIFIYLNKDKRVYNFKFSLIEFFQCIFCIFSLFYIKSIYSNASYENLNEIKNGSIKSGLEIEIIFLFNIILASLFVLKLIKIRYYDRQIFMQKLSNKLINDKLNYYKILEQNQNEILKFKHDYKNHLLLISDLSKKGKVKNIEKYLSTLINDYNIKTTKFSTGDNTIDSIINVKSNILTELNINIDIDGYMINGLKIDDYRKCIIFANVIDNAINAQRELNKRRYINIIIRNSSNYNRILVKNPISKDIKIVKNKVYNEKLDFNHGFGLSNILSAVEDINGMVNIESTDKEFIIEMFIPR